MINVRGLANSALQVVNPNVAIEWVQSIGGYTTAADGSREPITETRTINAQIQPLSTSDLMHTDGLNLQGTMRSVHMFGQVAGIVRVDQKGGDILRFAEAPGGAVRNWRVVTQMEAWPTWVRVIAQLQNP